MNRYRSECSHSELLQFDCFQDGRRLLSWLVPVVDIDHFVAIVYLRTKFVADISIRGRNKIWNQIQNGGHWWLIATSGSIFYCKALCGPSTSMHKIWQCPTEMLQFKHFQDVPDLKIVLFMTLCDTSVCDAECCHDH